MPLQHPHCIPNDILLHMLPSTLNSRPLPDVFMAKVTSLIQEQLKPIVIELAAQQQTLLTHLALLKHNHNVNDYQMTRLENIRNLEQSIKFAYHCHPSDHTTDRATVQL